mgnify:CR=1 FL=1
MFPCTCVEGEGNMDVPFFSLFVYNALELIFFHVLTSLSLVILSVPWEVMCK